MDIDELSGQGEAIAEKLSGYGYGEYDEPDAKPEDRKITYAEGNPIIGLEKFLGYYDDMLNIAYFPSISMNTDFSKAKAFCRYVKEENKDAVMMDGEQKPAYLARASKALERFKSANKIKGSFQFYIKREKRYSDAKGLGESAAVASATANAIISNAFGEEALGNRHLASRYARLVSGSGSRSASGAISIWVSYPKIREKMAYAVQTKTDYSKLNFVAFPRKLAFTTASAHKLALSSDFYAPWVSGKYRRISGLIEEGFPMEKMLKYAQEDMFRLDALLASSGAFIQDEVSLAIIRDAQAFSDKNPGLYITADTGPSIIAMSTDKSLLKEFLDGKQGFIEGSVTDQKSRSPSNHDAEEANSFFETLR